jgi:hypothetical protein
MAEIHAMDEIGTPLALTVMDWLASAPCQTHTQFRKRLKWGNYYEKIRFGFCRRRCLGLANGTCASRDIMFVVGFVDGQLLNHRHDLVVVDFDNQRGYANPRYDLSVSNHNVSRIGRLQRRSRDGCSCNTDY